MFVESERDPAHDPLVLWLNGGPGCSSLGGFLSENGPFHPNPDGTTLFENIYSWNQIANVLFLEAPRNVGFSWQNTSINADPTYNDLKTAHGTFLALMDFLSKFPEYFNRSFYITGESYAAIYIPTLTAFAIDKIRAGEAPGLNLVGIAIGNGELSMMAQLNSVMTMLFYRGVYGYTRYSKLMSCCKNNTIPAVYCDFHKYVTFKNSWALPLDSSECAEMIATFGSHYIWEESDIQDAYNLIADGYRRPYVNRSASSSEAYTQILRMYDELKQKDFDPSSVYGDRRSVINYDSTDGKGYFYFYQRAAMTKYLNFEDVRAALHIPKHIPKWVRCNDHINEIYDQQHNDTTPVFQHFIDTNYSLDILIYNGDVDLVCEFLGDEWFTENLAKLYKMKVTQNRSEWTYSGERAGYWKRFKSPVGNLDLVTIKGAGHYVPLDRPGPALQMLNAFINKHSYSKPLSFEPILSKIKEQYEIKTKIVDVTSDAANRDSRFGVSALSTSKETDQITSLPGQTFNATFQQFSGFLDITNQQSLHYWFFQHEEYVEKPLLLWLGDGPGCSAIYDALINIGPYRVDPTGAKLYENPYSWTQAASLLILEAMPGAGFSSAVKLEYDDDKVRSDLLVAINSFYDRFIELKQRPLYIIGKGYGSIYALMLAEKLQNDKEINLAGIGLGNGLLNYAAIINTLPNEMYFSGLLGKQEWDQLIPCCRKENGDFNNKCDLSQYVTVNNKGEVKPKDETSCAQLVANYAYEGMLQRKSPSGNMYRSCYKGTIPPFKPSKINNRVKRQAYHRGGLPLTNNYSFINQPTRTNYLSTDAFASFPCYMDYASSFYFNSDSVKEALHVSGDWYKCNSNLNYSRTYFDMTTNFERIIADAAKPLRILVFDGDSHLYNNFMANEWFIEDLAERNKMEILAPHDAWTYQKSAKYLEQYAGFVKTFLAKSSPKITIDLLTIKGAGYYIGLDRPAPALQMIFNYLSSSKYNTTVPIKPIQPVLPAYTPKPPLPVMRKEADRIYELPGLTYKLNFKQYAGYLNASKGNYLHYWFVESQGEPATDPLLIWFTGGPGCSSLGALLIENGPFRPNPDGRTLYENVFSWNKLGNVLFIESPRMVGFSYQDKTVNPSQEWNDEMTRQDAYLAIRDFYDVFPELKNNSLYITGESYGGVYVPTLTSLLVDLIKNGTIDWNLKGIAIGNGYLSQIQNIRSLPNYMYFHGIYGKEVWDELQYMCCNDTDPDLPITHCPLEQYVTVDEQGSVIPKNTTPAIKACGEMVETLVQTWTWETMNYVYNLYQDCYQQTEPIFSFDSEFHHRKMMNLLMEQNRATVHANIKLGYMKAMPWFVYTHSTDAIGGFPCYMFSAATKYLSQQDVRQALHVPDYVDTWLFCSQINYTKQVNDTGSYFENILRKGYPLRVLLYSGDLDTACSMNEAEWFIEDFAKQHEMSTKQQTTPWMYQLSSNYDVQVGGYWKRFEKDNLTIDLLTVKGAGHMVPTDRAGPCLQMITNFVFERNYSIPSNFSYERQILLPEFAPLSTKIMKNITTATTNATTKTTTTTTITATKTTTTSSIATRTTTEKGTTTEPKGVARATFSSRIFFILSTISIFLLDCFSRS